MTAALVIALIVVTLCFILVAYRAEMYKKIAHREQINYADAVDTIKAQNLQFTELKTEAEREIKSANRSRVILSIMLILLACSMIFYILKK